MNSIDEEEEEEEEDEMTVRSVDQFPSVRPPSKFNNNNICSSKQSTSIQIDRTKYQITNRSTSLPSRQTYSSNENITDNVRQRRRHVSDSNNNNKVRTTSLVTSFIQYLRCELRAITNDQKHDHSRIHKNKSTDYLSQTFNLSNNFYRQQYPIRMSSLSSIELNSSNENNDDNEISKLIELLILRVECLANENTLINKKIDYPTIKQIDENLIEYLYYLFNKFIQDDQSDSPQIDKTNFVNVCQNLVRNGCFNLPASTSPDQSLSESTITNSSDQILPQTFVHEYRTETDDMSLKQTSLINDQDTWLIVDLEPIKPIYSSTNPEQSKCLLPSSTSDDQFLLPNENYFSFEEIKSYESESSQSNYYSPDSSLIDLQNMVQDFDEINNTNNNNNTLFNEDGSSTATTPENKTNIINETIETTNKNSICTGLTIDEHVASSSMESTDSLLTKQNEKISRRERKMQERWTTSTKTDPEQSPPKTFLGVEFPPIAVLRKKFSSLPPTTPTVLNPLPIKKKDPSSSKTKALLQQIETNNPSKSMILQTSDQKINTSIVNNTKHEEVLDLQTNGTSSLNDIQPSLTKPSELLTNEKNVQGDMTTTTTTNVKHRNHFDLSIDSEILNSPSSSLLSISSSASSPPSSSSPASTTNTNENKTIEFLLKEIEEEKKEEEVYCGDGDNVDEEKKNNCNVEHASGTLLINGEPTQLDLLEQEKKEEQETERTLLSSSLSPKQEPCCSQIQIEDKPSKPDLTNDIQEMIMTNIDQNEQRYKTIEIEEIPDEEDDLSIHNNPSIEPTDCILTDDELIISSKQSKMKNTSPKLDPVLSCYEEALSKAVETIDVSTKEEQLPKRSQRPEDDPIALRALQRFQERMNAAAAAAKTNTDETNSIIPKGKSSWSGTHATPRKSVENLFKANQQSELTSASNVDKLSPQRDTFIRPRKTFLDDVGLNFGMTTSLFGTVQNNSIHQIDDDNHHKLEEQHQPTAIAVEDDNKQNEPMTVPTTANMIDTEDDSQPPMNINSSTTTNESSFSSEADNSNSLPAPTLENISTNSSLNTVISCSSTDQQSLTPYRLQLEGRRRLNTLERIRERRQNQQLNEAPQLPPPPPPPSQQQQLQFQNEYTLKPEDLQDPIIRRALERFDEKSRSLAQAKTINYDNIQDPITRRALMRLDSNLKRTISSNNPAPTNTDSNETWYTNSYTLGSLQSNADPRFLRYPESSLPPTVNHKPSHVSIHQRFCSTSSAELVDFSENNALANNDQDIPVMRVPVQPVYVTSNNQSQTGFRQRSRSEDMLSSRELTIGQTTNLDDSAESAPLERNHSSNELHSQDISLSNEPDCSLPDPIVNDLEPNFVRSPETSVNYVTPTQTYSAYGCEYTHPHHNQSIASPKLSPRNLQQENEIQSSSAFLPVHPSTNNYYPQAPLPPPSYNSIYTQNNLNQTPYSDDPIVRRALERFNCQMQNSLMSMSHHQPNNNYMPRQYSNGYPPRQGSFDTFQQIDTQWNNVNRSMAPPPLPPPPTSSTSTGYQSIIGRRRQMRHDDSFPDHTSVGNGYSSSLFINSQNSYPYMNYSDEPPALTPRLHRDLYYEQQQQQQQLQQEYLSENLNNNNNNGYIHHVYPGGTMNGYHPVNHQYIPGDYYQQIQDEEYLRHRAQSTSSNTSSDSVNQIRLMQQRLPPSSTRTNYPSNNPMSPDHLQIPSGQTTPSNGSTTGDSVFHRLAYTATKSSLSKSSSNLCTNVLPKTPPQQQLTKSNTLKVHEIDYDESTATNTEQNSDSISTSATTSNKCQRSRSVDGRARLKSAQTRLNTSARSTNEYDDHNPSSAVPSSKFTSVNPRRDAPLPRAPMTPRSINSDRTPSSKRVPNGNNLSSTKNGNGVRARGSNGNLIDSEHEENAAYNDHYQPKIVDNKPRTTIPLHRYSTTNNHIQTSASASTFR